MSQSLAARLWTYQAERFPLFKTALLVLFFTAATISVSATLAGRALPNWTVFAGVWFCVLILFFQMRVADEFKDYEVDLAYRPERAVPRGLVTRRLLAWLAVFFGGLALFVTGLISFKLIWPLLAVWLWLGLMSFEFFVPDWLKSRPLIYLISHMAIMPLIDFYVSAAEWLDYGDKPGLGLYLFYALSFLNGCVLEFGRKIWAPENEREGVETYSASYGPKRAVTAWAMACILAAVTLLCVSYFLGTWLWVLLPTVLILGGLLKLAFDFASDPTAKRQKWLDTASGLWVLSAYGLAGFVPLIGGL